MKRLHQIFLAALFAIASIGCGGGGGGGGDQLNYAGDLDLTVEKEVMDSGDFNRIQIQLFNINPQGVILKLHYPTSIKYSKNSAVLTPSRKNGIQITPFTEATTGSDRYLVFFISRDETLEQSHATVDLDLKASSSDPDAFVEVDLDNNDPNIADGQEFSESEPRFTALDRRDIEIKLEDSVSVTPTPEPTDES